MMILKRRFLLGKNEIIKNIVPVDSDIDVPPGDYFLKDDSLEIKRLEVAEERKEKRHVRAFRLIYFCLFGILVIYLIDIVITALFEDGIAKYSSSIFEILKALLFTLTGYLFGSKASDE